MPRPRLVSVEDALAAEDEAAGGEIRARHDLRGSSVSGVSGFWTSAMVALTISRQIVRRNVGRHADRDARGAIDQQVGDARRENFGLDCSLSS